MATPSSLGLRPVPGTGGNRYYAPKGYSGPVAENEGTRWGDLGGRPTITRRQARNIGVQRQGLPSQSAYERAQRRLLREDPRYRNFRRIYMEEHNGKRPDANSGFLAAYVKASPLLDGKRTSREYRSSNGPVAQFLTIVGLRRPDDKRPVGSS